MQLFNFKRKEPALSPPELLPPSARSPEMEEAIARWQEIFLGREPWLSHKRPRSLRLAASCSQYLSRLVCGELELNFPATERGDFLKQSVEQELLPQLPMALQQALASGAVALKPYVEGGRLKLEWLSRSQFYPLEKGQGMVFLRHAAWGKKLWLRAEEHRWEKGLYRIRNRAFSCDPAGRPKAPAELRKIPAWADVEEEVAIEGLRSPLYAIWQLPLANTVDGSDQPQSLYANGEQILADMDRLYNDYCFEFETARRKVILREDALRLRSDGSPLLPHWEQADDVFLPLDFGGESQPFGDYTPAIREESYRAAFNQLLRLFELQCGLSNGTFSLDEKGAVTATEIISQDRRTFYTVREIQQQGKAALEQLLSAMGALCDLYELCPAGDSKAAITFGDSIFEDSGVELERRLKLVELGMKPELLLAWYFGCDEEQAKTMMKGVE